LGGRWPANSIAAVLRRDRRTWVHTVREEFATYYPLADLMRWLGGDPFIQIGRHAVVSLNAIEQDGGNRRHKERNAESNSSSQTEICQGSINQYLLVGQNGHDDMRKS
jgi:hypothetical protein